VNPDAAIGRSDAGDPLSSFDSEPASTAGADSMDSAVETPALDVTDLRVNIGLGSRILPAVAGVTFSLCKAKTLGIVGESGSGKSVMARALLGLLPNSRSTLTGSVRLYGREMVGLSLQELRHHRGKDIALVFQDPMRSLNPIMCVGSQITETLHAHTGLSRRDSRDRAKELLRLVRVPSPEHRFDQYPHQLSGGLRQRVMIAMAVACDPKVLVLDEPTTALDVTTQAQIMSLLHELQEKLSMSIILITHDIGLVGEHADDIAVMYAGRIVEQGRSSEILDSPRMPYTRALLDAVPRLDAPGHEPLVAIGGVPPDLMALGPGCAFTDRCRFAQTKCAEELPPLEMHGPDHWCACWYPL
jgi:oligopeptide/dipeptide ABC transporter ATP-binding protein